MTTSQIAVMKSALGQSWNAEEWLARQKMKERIPVIIDLLKDLWSANPDQRLCQLIMNVLNFHGDPFDVEDKVLKERLNYAVEQHQWKKVRTVNDCQSGEGASVVV